MSGHPRFTMTPAECAEHLRRFYFPLASYDASTQRYTDASYCAIRACATGREDAFEDLVQRGMTDMDEIRNNSDQTLFSIAVEGENMKLAKRILELGADPYATDRNGDNVFFAFLCNVHTKNNASHLSAILVLYPDFIKMRSRDGRTCLHYDVSDECLRILLEAGAWNMVNRCVPGRRRVGSPVDCRPLSVVTDSLKTLVAYGGRKGGSDGSMAQRPDQTGYDTLMSRLCSCGRVAAIITKLAALKSAAVRGNGRDALRLVARMVWVHRMDEEWDAVR